MSASEVLKTIKEKDVKFIDLRFTDTRGKEQHVSIPAHTADEDMFKDGKMFDGSSIAGWKGIQESDMVLMPEASSAVMDPFMDEATLIIRCDILEPHTMQGYERDPRSLAKRAEAYLKSTGIADTAFFGPEPNSSSSTTCAGARTSLVPFIKWTPKKRRGIPRPPSARAISVIVRASKAATSPCRRSMHCKTSAPRCASRSKRWASPSRCIITRSRRPASARSAPSSTP